MTRIGHHHHHVHGADAAQPQQTNVKPATSQELNQWFSVLGLAALQQPLIDLSRSLDALVKGLNFAELGGGLSAPGEGCGRCSPLGDLGALFNPPDVHTPPSIGPGGCFPCPPPERALSTEVPGFPKGSVKTAGGYVIVPEGKDAAWSIYSPGQKATDKPMSRIWGDPHVNESDGTRWDFTRNSNFRLPDGTTISVDTTSQTGQSVSRSLDITNGGSHVTITGINDKAGPKTSAVSYDGFRYRASKMGERTEFVLGKADGKKVEWFRQDKNGNIEGLITGSKQDAKKSYDQVLKKGKDYVVDPHLLPPFGSAAWNRVLNAELNDALNKFFPFLAKSDDDAAKRAEQQPRFQHCGGDLIRYFEKPLTDSMHVLRDFGNLLNQLNWLNKLVH